MTLATEDIVAIQQLEAYCHHVVDDPDVLALLDRVFTADAVFDGTRTGGPLFEGLEAIGGFFALGKPPHPPVHQLTNLYVYEEDGAVRARMKWLCPNPAGTSWFGGDSIDTVVETPVGWRISRREATLRFGVPGTP